MGLSFLCTFHLPNEFDQLIATQIMLIVKFCKGQVIYASSYKSNLLVLS